MKVFIYLFVSLSFLASCREQSETSYTAIRSLKGQQTQGNTGDPTGWKFKQMVFASIAD